MLNRTCAAVIAGAMLLPAAALGQQQIQWSQTLNLPKGLNLPGGIKADILGIEVGDTYAEAKAKLEKVAAETGARVEEARTVIRLGASPATAIEASYVGQIKLDRELPGSGQQKIREIIEAHFSAPSSGNQVLSIQRRIIYPTQADQPRVSELISALRQKFKTQGKLDGVYYLIHFGNGQPKVSQYPAIVCGGAGWARPSFNQNEIPQINRTRECDVGLVVNFSYGISQDHAAAIHFLLLDNERAKANLTADFAFFDDYVRKLQSRPGAAAPKL